MTIGAIFSLILGIVKAIPIFQKWLEQFFAFYLDNQIKAHEKEFVEAMAALIREGSQVKLEDAIGSDNAGKPAIRNDGVLERPRNETNNNPTDDS